MSGHEWRPLGVRGTLRFLFVDRYARVASWRHWGWELEVEMAARFRPNHVSLWRILSA